MNSTSIFSESKEVEAYIEEGTKLSTSGQIEAAQKLYLEALEVIADSAELYRKLGETSLELQQWEAAIDHYQEAIELDPNNYWSHSSLGKALAAEQRYQEAINHYQRAIELEPERSYAYRQLGQMLLQLNRWQEAIQMLEKAIAIEPNDSWIYYDLGKAYSEQCSWSKALGCYQKFTALEPDFWEGHFRLGQVLEQLKRYDQAISSYQQAIAANPSFPWHYFYLGNCLAEQKRWLEAIANYRQAKTIDPSIGEVYQKLGSALIEQQQWQEAAAVLEAGIAINSYSFELHYNLGIALTRLDNSQQAVNCFRQCIALNSTHTFAYIKLIKILITQQEWLEAEKWLYQANTSCSEHLEILNDLGKKVHQVSKYSQSRAKTEFSQTQSNQPTKDCSVAAEKFKQAEIFTNQHNWQQAVVTYQEAIAYNPDNSWYFCCLGVAQQQAQEYDAAIKSYNQAIELDSTSPWYYKCLGGLLFEQEKWQQAIDCYQKALELKPEDFWYCENLGIALFNLEQWPEAEQFLTKALELCAYDTKIQDKLAKALLKQEKWKEAEAVSNNALKLVCDCIELYDNLIEALEKLEKDSTANQIREQQRLQKIVLEQREKIRLNPQELDNYVQLAKAQEKLGNLAAAAATYCYATQIDRNCPWWLYASWGQLLAKVGQWKTAEAAYRRAKTLKQPENSAWLNQGLGEVLFKLGKWTEVVAVYSGETLEELSSPKAYDYYAQALLKIQNPTQAIEIYQYALTKFSDKVWWQAKLYNALGNIYYNLENWQQAQVNYEKSLKLGIQDFINYNNLGDCLLQQKKLEEATDYYQQNLVYRPSLSWSYKLALVGWHYHKLGDDLLQKENYFAAEKAYQKAIKFNPDASLHYLRLAETLEKQEKWQQAYQISKQIKDLEANQGTSKPKTTQEIINQLSDRSLIVCIYTCEANQHKQKAIRDTWLKHLSKYNIPYFFVIGQPSVASHVQGDTLYVDAPDDYGHLSQKTYKLFEYIYRETCYAHVLKIDDDCYLNIEALLQTNFTDRDYTGKIVGNAKNLLKSRSQDQVLLAQYSGRYQGSWADGSSGYILNRHAMQKLVTSATSEAINSEIYEDKFVGDVLRKHDIEPSCGANYVVGIERCDRSTGHKLAFQAGNESAYPHFSNKTVIFHSDDTPRFFYEIEERFKTNNQQKEKDFLRNFSWFEKNNKSHICLERKDNKEISLAPDDILCFMVERNESLRLPYVLKYYREKGVNKFFIVDNHSTNETLSYLLEQPDVYLWHTSRSYAGSKWGVDWIEILLQNYAFNHWCVLVDADELLYYPDCETKNIRQLCQELDSQGNNAFSTVLLDMYSQKPLREANYKSGENFLDTCRYFDKKFYTANALGGGPEKNITAYFGGLRQRIFGGENNSFCINKAPLIKYNHNIRLYEGFHWIGNVNLAPQTGCLLHFKYFSTFHEYAKQESQRGEHWNGGSEYMKYFRKLEENPQLTFWDQELSVKLESSQTLADFGVIKG